MNRQQFEHFLHFPGELSSAHLEDLGELVSSFPYCPTLYLMLAKAHSSADSVYFQRYLHLAAARAVDRKRLRQLILVEPGTLASSHEISEDATEPDALLPDHEPMDFQHFRKLITQLEQAFTELQMQRDKHRAYDIEKEFEGAGRYPVTLPLSEQDHDREGSPDGQSLEEAGIQPSRPSFFDPVDIARKSVIEHDDVASETLARIYADQGYFQRAIKIYQHLMLKFPEKSRYFAAQIKKLESNPEFKH
ncbi:MAG TPA: hypothetical protein PKH94_01415 [Bacteroidales bacterium]|nr:hypothetical protein [Bacteroidales bacterium]HNS45875.1 hypothetical protein [Bacteroidales bacterium]